MVDTHLIVRDLLEVEVGVVVGVQAGVAVVGAPERSPFAHRQPRIVALVTALQGPMLRFFNFLRQKVRILTLNTGFIKNNSIVFYS
jgi:hypothetical protein